MMYVGTVNKGASLLHYHPHHVTHIERQSYQPAAFSGISPRASPRQSMPYFAYAPYRGEDFISSKVVVGGISTF